MGIEGGCGHLVVADGTLESAVAPGRLCRFFDDGRADDHSAEVYAVCGVGAHLWEVDTEEWCKQVADLPAKSGSDGFGGFIWHPVA
jgi:hypothetical protein